MITSSALAAVAGLLAFITSCALNIVNWAYILGSRSGLCDRVRHECPPVYYQPFKSTSTDLNTYAYRHISPFSVLKKNGSWEGSALDSTSRPSVLLHQDHLSAIKILTVHQGYLYLLIREC